MRDREEEPGEAPRRLTAEAGLAAGQPRLQLRQRSC